MSPLSQADRDRRYSELLSAHGLALRRLSRSYMARPEDQEDLFQEIALGLWTALPSFRGSSSLRTWVFRVAHNVALTFRAGRRRHRADSSLTEAVTDDAATRDAHLDVAALLRTLDPLDRQLLTLDLEGLSDREIADVTGLTTSNTSVRLMRARRRLTDAVQATRSGHGTDT